jgi:hypothetical protein
MPVTEIGLCTWQGDFIVETVRDIKETYMKASVYLTRLRVGIESSSHAQGDCQLLRASEGNAGVHAHGGHEAFLKSEFACHFVWGRPVIGPLLVRSRETWRRRLLYGIPGLAIVV